MFRYCSAKVIISVLSFLACTVLRVSRTSFISLTTPANPLAKPRWSEDSKTKISYQNLFSENPAQCSTLLHSTFSSYLFEGLSFHLPFSLPNGRFQRSSTSNFSTRPCPPSPSMYRCLSRPSSII